MRPGEPRRRPLPGAVVLRDGPWPRRLPLGTGSQTLPLGSRWEVRRGSGQARSPGARGLHALGVRVAWVLPGTRGLQESDRVAFRLFPRQETREGALGRGCGSDKGWGPGGWGDSDPGGHSLT